MARNRSLEQRLSGCLSACGATKWSSKGEGAKTSNKDLAEGEKWKDDGNLGESRDEHAWHIPARLPFATGGGGAAVELHLMETDAGKKMSTAELQATSQVLFDLLVNKTLPPPGVVFSTRADNVAIFAKQSFQASVERLLEGTSAEAGAAAGASAGAAAGAVAGEAAAAAGSSANGAAAGAEVVTGAGHQCCCCFTAVTEPGGYHCPRCETYMCVSCLRMWLDNSPGTAGSPPAIKCFGPSCTETLATDEFTRQAIGEQHSATPL